jgi:hypothetical protein
MNRFFSFIGALMVTAAAFGQELTEKIDVTLVNVDVTVTSRSHSVRGFTRDDFEVREDGVPQTITNFYAVENTPAAKPERGVAAAPAPTQKPAPAPVVDDRFRRKVLVVVDYVHTSKINRNRALERLEQFIDDRFTTGEYDWSIAIAGMDMRMVLPLTSDKARIHDAIEAMRHDTRWQPSRDVPAVKLDIRLPVVSSGADSDPTYTYLSFRVVLDSMRSFGGTEGKKIILLIGGDFGLMMNRPDIGAIMGRGPRRTLMTFRDELIHEANASNVNLYIIDPDGLTLGSTGSRYWMGRETGGSFLAGNNPEVSLKKFDELTSNFYSLAYRPTHPEDGKYHRLTVRLKRPGSYNLQYRDGYGTLSIEAQLARTLATPHAATMQASSIPLTITTRPAQQGKNGAMLLPVAITVPLTYLQFVPARSGSEALVTLFISVFDEDGRTLGVQSFTTKAHAPRDERTNHGELTYTALVRLNPGAIHTIVVAIHDQLTDAVGVVKQRIEF